MRRAGSWWPAPTIGLRAITTPAISWWLATPAAAVLDGSFGSGGWTLVDFNGKNDEARAIGIDSQGRLIVAGQARHATASYYEIAVARLTGGGSLDATFDGDGRATAKVTLSGANGCGLAIDGSDRSVVVGQAVGAFAVARFTDTGGLDPTFDGDGVTTTDLTWDYDQANRVVLQPDGKIVVAGEAGFSGATYSGDFGVVRYLVDGNLDTSFGDDGKVLTNFTERDVATGLALDADGRIVAVGGTNLHNQPGARPSYALARYLPDGTLDPAFGAGGKMWTLIGSISSYARGGVVIQPDGRLVVGGAASTDTTLTDFAVARYGVLADQGPLADAGGPYVLDEGGDVMLDGSGSTHPGAPDRTIVGYEWDLDYDGTTFTAELGGVQPARHFSDDTARRTIALRVTDSVGMQNIATATLEVNNVPPTLTLQGPPTVVTGGPYPLDLAAQDPGDDTISRWTIDWGDGVLETVPGGLQRVTHTYALGGDVYTINATATDEDDTFAAGNTVVVEVLASGASLDGDVLCVAGTPGNDSVDVKLRTGPRRQRMAGRERLVPPRRPGVVRIESGGVHPYRPGRG